MATALDTGSSDLDGATFGSIALFQQLDAYPWDEDEEFQGGLRAILGHAHDDPAQVAHLTLRAKCYYFARKAGTPVDFDAYKAWVESQAGGRAAAASSARVNGDSSASHGTDHPIVAPVEAGTAGGNAMGDAPKPASFTEICDLIAQGLPIPGIKEIPDTILEGQASESTAEKRKKPWEKDTTSGEGGSAQLSWMS